MSVVVARSCYGLGAERRAAQICLSPALESSHDQACCCHGPGHARCAAAFGQIIDPLTGNMTTTESPTIQSPTMQPPAAILAPACETRRMEFDDGFGLRARDVLVCCVQGQCTYRLIE